MTFFHRLLLVFTTTVLAFAQLAAGPAVATTDETAQIEKTLKLCFDLPKTRDATNAALAELGWTGPEPGVTGKTLVSVFAAQQQDSEDPIGWLENATFMAASSLGNSALAPGQPGYVRDGARLAVLGHDLGLAHCALAMDGRFAETAAAQLQTGIRVQSGQGYAGLGVAKNRLIFFGVLRPDLIAKDVETADTDDRRREFARSALKEAVMSVNVMIIPLELAQ